MKIVLFCVLISVFSISCLRNGEGNTCGRPNGNDFAFQEEKIVEGYDLGYLRYPWYVALIYPDTKTIACGAALVGDKAVVTAAHCYKEYVVGGKRKSSKATQSNNTKLEDVYIVLLGVYNKCQKEKTQKPFAVEKVHVHEKYKDNWPYFDIALLTLKESAAAYEPICLPKSYIKSRPREGSVPGLGTIRYHGSVPCTLREARLLIYSDKDCQQMINRTGNDPKKIHGAFCAGYMQGGIDTCQGDSGGPFQIVDAKGNYILLGLVSFGFHCANPGLLGVYTDVTQFVDWIQSKTGFKAIDPDENSTSTTGQDVSPVSVTKSTTSTDNDIDNIVTDDGDTVTPAPVKPSGSKPTHGKPWVIKPPYNYPQVIEVIRPVVRPINIFIFKNKKKNGVKEKSMPVPVGKHKIKSAKKTN